MATQNPNPTKAAMATETTETQVMYVGPGGRAESQDDHDRRLAINAKMRFHRSLQSFLSLLTHMPPYTLIFGAVMDCQLV